MARGWPGIGWVVAGAAVGVTVPLLQRSAAPTTRSQSSAVAMTPTTGPAVAPPRGVIPIGDSVLVHPGDGSIDLTHGRRIVSIHPLLTFTSRSPDRFWTCFAPRPLREGPRRALRAIERDGDDVTMAYDDDASSSLRVVPRTDELEQRTHSVAAARTFSGLRSRERPLAASQTGKPRYTEMPFALDITAMSTLPADVYSHLNAYTELHVAGHRRLSVRFSPCPATPVAVTPQDGMPARFAYLDTDGVFHVAQARRDEKGPFTDLATGPLARGEPLTITLIDENEPFLTITLRDWSSQASVAASPTAGWGVPQNAIEFSLGGPSDRSPASLFVTLAATSVGRGFDSVGHTAGTYVNRIDVRPVGATD